MIGVSDLLIRVRTDTSQAVGGLNAMSAGMIGLGLGAAAATVEFAKMGIEAENQLAVVQGFTGSTKTQMNQYVAGLEQMASTLGFTMSEGAKGLYYVVSAGFQGADALNVLKVAAMGAVASGASLKDVANGLTSAMNAYGAKASEAGRYSDIMAVAVTYGKQTFGDFAENVGKAALMAANTHVPFTQLAAAESALTEKGLPAANAMTYLRYMFSKITEGVPDLAAAVIKAGGHFDIMKYQSLDLVQKLLYLRDSTGITNAEFVKLTGGARGSQAALGLVSDNGAAFNKILLQMGENAGITSRAFKVHDVTMVGAFEDIKGAISVAAYEFTKLISPDLAPVLKEVADDLAHMASHVDMLKPAVDAAARAFSTVLNLVDRFAVELMDVATWLSQHPVIFGLLIAGIQTLALAFAGFRVVNFLTALTSIIGPLSLLPLKLLTVGAGLITVAPTVDVATMSFAALDVTIGALTLPLWLVVAAVAAVAAGVVALIYWIENTKQGMAAFHAAIAAAGADFSALGTVMHDRVLPVLAAVGAMALQVGGWIRDQLVAAVGFLRPQFEQAATTVQRFGASVQSQLAPALRQLGIDMPTIVQGLRIAFQVILPAIQYLWNSTWDNIRTTLETVWGVMKGLVMIYWSLISGGITIGLDLLAGKWGKAWGDMKGMASGVWAGIAQIVTSILGSILVGILNTVTTLAMVFTHIPGPVGDMARAVLNEIRDLRSNTQTQVQAMSDATQRQMLEMKIQSLQPTVDLANQTVAHYQTMALQVVDQMSHMKDGAAKQALGTKLAVLLQQEEMAVGTGQNASLMQNQLIAKLNAMSTGAASISQQMRINYLDNIIATSQQSVAKLDDMRLKILDQIARTKDGAGKTALEMQLTIVNAQEATAVQTYQSASQMRAGVVSQVGDMHGRVAGHVASMGSSTTASFATMHASSVKHSQDMGATVQQTLANTWNAVTSNVGSFMSNFGKTVHDGFSSAGQGIGGFFNGLGTQVHNGLSAAGQDIGKFFSGLGTSTHDGLSSAGKTIGDFFSNMGRSVHDGLSAAGQTIGGFFSGLGKTVHDGLSAAGQNIGAFFSGIGTWAHNSVVAVQDELNRLWNWMKPFWDTIGGIFRVSLEIIGKLISNFGTFAHGLWDALVSFIGQKMSDLGTFLRKSWDGLTSFIGGKMSDLGTLLRGTWDSITSYIGSKMSAFGDLMHRSWDALMTYLGQRLSDLGAFARKTWDGITAYIGDKMSAFGDYMHRQWDALSAYIGQKMIDLGATLRGLWDRLSAYIGQKMSDLGSLLRRLWDDLTSYIGNKMSAFGDMMNRSWSQLSISVGNTMSRFGATLRGDWDNLTSYIGGKISDLGATLNRGWINIENDAKSGINHMIDALNAGLRGINILINDIANGLNTIAKALGVNDRVPNLPPFTPIPHLARGARNFGGGMALVGEEGPELVNLPAGTAVIPASITQALLAKKFGAPGFANGVGDIGASIMNWLGGGAASLLKNVLDATGAGRLSLPQPLSRDAGALYNRVFNEAVQDVQKWMTGFFSLQGGAGSGMGSLAHPNVSGSVVQWLLAAISATHVPTSWLTGLEIIAQHESGGNPNAVNRTDSNWLAGHPSMGLMQTIMGTFLRYMLPGHNQIFNPVDNAIAAIRYIESVYGGINNVPGVRAVESGRGYVGYATGGWINEPILGVGRSGTRYSFGETGPEYISPSGRSGASGKTYHFENHFHGSNLTVQDVVREQAWQVMLHGNH